MGREMWEGETWEVTHDGAIGSKGNSARNLVQLITRREALCVSLQDPIRLCQAGLQGLFEAGEALRPRAMFRAINK